MILILVLVIYREYQLFVYFLFFDLRFVLDFFNIFLREEEFFLDFREEVEFFSEDIEFLREDWEFFIEEVEFFKEEVIFDKEVKEFFLVILKFFFFEDFFLFFREFFFGDFSEFRFLFFFSDNDCRLVSGKGCNFVSDFEDCLTGLGRRFKEFLLDAVVGFFIVFRMLLRYCSYCFLSC